MTKRTGRRRRPRRVLAATGLVLLGGVLGALLFGGGAPVGYFRSADGRNAYLAAYDEALALGPAPDETIDVPTDYGFVRMLRYDAGSTGGAAADPLVLLPGTQSGAPMWVDAIPALAAERPVYVVDLLGQPGRSVQSRPIETGADDARWLAQALEAVPGDPTVLGHSLGGWVAANLAVHEPEAAASIVLIDPVLTFADLAPGAVVRSVPASVGWLPRSWRDAFASWTANDAPVQDEPVAEMIEAGMQHYSLGTPASARFGEGELAGLEARVLVIVAGASRMHDAVEVASNAESELSDATVITYDGASHAITSEQPDRIAADVEAFLGED